MHFDNTDVNSKQAEKEMLFFVPLCTHENAKECLSIGFDNIPQEAIKLAANITTQANQGEKFDSESFDVVVTNDENTNKQDIFRVLKKDGVLCMKLGNDVKKQLTELGSFYRIVMPFFGMKLVFASNKYHPTADIILDKADFLEGVEYYNADIHLASFAIYEKAKKELKGIIKA